MCGWIVGGLTTYVTLLGGAQAELEEVGTNEKAGLCREVSESPGGDVRLWCNMGAST
jgi:hypothetical protein